MLHWTGEGTHIRSGVFLQNSSRSDKGKTWAAAVVVVVVVIVVVACPSNGPKWVLLGNFCHLLTNFGSNHADHVLYVRIGTCHH